MTPTHRERIKVAHTQLSFIHPALFDLEKPLPFSIGFHDELRSLYPSIPKIILKGLLWWLTRRRAYLQACTPGANRYGIFGVSGVVSAAEADHARKLHAERTTKSGSPKMPPKKARKNRGPI